MQVGDTVRRTAARASSLLPKGTVGTVAMLTQHNLVLTEYPNLVLPLEDFVKV